jgi:small-conductance mechanosensitive channel
MARTETPKKRVSNLVGRFEQLAQSSPVQEYTYPSPESPTSPRPASQHGDKTWTYDRRCLSLSSKPSAPCLSIRLERELTRNAKLRQEIEDLRLHCTEGDEILTTLSQRLEAGTELQASLHMQTSGLQTKVDRLADKLARRDKIQKAEYERRIVAVANERDMLASKLRMADASVERARALEDTVKSSDEKARIAEEKAQIADNRITTMRSQLLELKTNIAARSGFPADVSDQEILDMMTKLNHLVQNWCVSSFRKIKIGMSTQYPQFQYMLTCSRSAQDGP